MVRVKLSDRARDERRNHTFTLRQFRLVGRRPGEDSYEQYFPIAIQQEDKDDPTNRHIRYKNFGGTFAPVIDQKYAPRDGNHQEVEIVFEIPSAFRPAFLEYKREARVAVSFEKPRAAGRAPAHPRRRLRPLSGRLLRARRAYRISPRQHPRQPRTPRVRGAGDDPRRTRAGVEPCEGWGRRSGSLTSVTNCR
jgi:hypothetical protein